MSTRLHAAPPPIEAEFQRHLAGRGLPPSTTLADLIAHERANAKLAATLNTEVDERDRIARIIHTDLPIGPCCSAMVRHWLAVHVADTAELRGRICGCHDHPSADSQPHPDDALVVAVYWQLNPGDVETVSRRTIARIVGALHRVRPDGAYPTDRVFLAAAAHAAGFTQAGRTARTYVRGVIGALRHIGAPASGRAAS